MAALVMLVILVVMGLGVIIWNKSRVRGKMLCYMLKEDKSILQFCASWLTIS